MAQEWIEGEEGGEGQSPSKTFTHGSKTREGSLSLREHMTSTAPKNCKEISIRFCDTAVLYFQVLVKRAVHIYSN